MKELYWINILGNLHVVCIGLAILLGTVLVVGIVGFLNGEFDDIVGFLNGEFDDDDQAKKVLRYIAIGLIVFIIGSVFIPSKRDLYIIYGIGNTIDYVKENNTAQKLPDKTIECLDKFMDEYLNKKEDE